MKSYGNGILIAVACILVFMAIRTYVFVVTPQAPQKALMIDIKPGTSAWRISKELKKQGVITNAPMFMATAVLTGKVTRLQAGIYVFEGRHFPMDIISILFRGRTMKYRITIPEGSTIFDVGAIVAETGLLSKADFIAGARSTRAREFFKVDAPSMEGFLYPDTYFLAPHMTSLEIMSKMVNRFHEAIPVNYGERCAELGISLTDAVTLASMIQKEAVTAKEKPVIASVFHNRLRLNMQLQSDPTAVYGIEGFRRRILPEDLKRNSPYNTYKCPGLPPGPICNPDSDSIRAALWPARTGYLFFVSKGNGTHHFSRTYEEHTRAVQHLRAASGR